MQRKAADTQTLFTSKHNDKTQRLTVPRNWMGKLDAQALQDAINSAPKYRIEVRKKYARKSKVYIVPSVTVNNFTRPDIFESLTHYEIAGNLFAKEELALFSSSIIE